MSWVSDRRLQYFYEKFKAQIKNYIQRTKAINLLDNSDFTNPVNTTGATTYTGSKYTIDRWKANSGYSIVTVNADSLNIKSSNGNTVYFQQFIEGGAVKAGRTYTVACTLKDGSVHCMSGVASTDMTEAIRYMYVDGVSIGTVRFKYDSYYESYLVMLSTAKTDGIDVVNVALYEGDYTNDTLPIYQPRGYSIEAVICSGGSLNFKVVGGTTQPTNPSENTIWVNTSTAINGYAFSADEPASPTEGMVWIKTAIESTTPLNVDKKNTVMLYPQAVQQYVSGAWVGKSTKIYTGGAWHELWDGYYYKLGETYDAITGGYETTVSDNTGGNNNASLTFNSNNMVLTAANKSTQGGNMAVSVKAIDVTNVNTLVFDCQADGNDECIVGVTTQKGVWGGDVASKKITSTARANVSVDVSKVTGNVYILLKAWWNKSTYKGKLTVYNIYKQ